MPERLRTTVYRVVFWRCDNLEIFMIASLQGFDESNADPRCEKRILPVGLLTSSPPRIAEDIDIWSPQIQPIIDGMVAMRDRIGILCTRFSRDDRSLPADEIYVPARGHADSLRENSCISRNGDAMNRLTPPVICGYPKSRNCGSLVLHL